MHCRKSAEEEIHPTVHQKLKLVEKGDTEVTILVVFVSCSKLAEYLHVAFTSGEKHCPVIFFAGLLLVFEK